MAPNKVDEILDSNDGQLVQSGEFPSGKGSPPLPIRLNVVLGHRVDDCFLIWEVLIERSDGHAGFLRDAIHARSVEAVLGKRLRSDLDDISNAAFATRLALADDEGRFRCARHS